VLLINPLAFGFLLCPVRATPTEHEEHHVYPRCVCVPCCAMPWPMLCAMLRRAEHGMPRAARYACNSSSRKSSNNSSAGPMQTTLRVLCCAVPKGAIQSRPAHQTPISQRPCKLCPCCVRCCAVACCAVLCPAGPTSASSLPTLMTCTGPLTKRTPACPCTSWQSTPSTSSFS
jgi:hypothetical protein